MATIRLSRLGVFTHALIQRHDFLIEVQRSTTNASARMLVHWNDKLVGDIISQTKQSIDIVDTYYDEATYLAPHIFDAILNTNSSLDISISMLDPAGPFGAQRLLERRDPTAANGKDMSNYKSEYDTTFKTECRRLINQFSHTNALKQRGVHPNIFTYNVMPGMRMIVVDDTYFIVGWYPLGDSNPTYPCLLVDAHSQARSDQIAIAKIREQLEWIKKIRRPLDIETILV